MSEKPVVVLFVGSSSSTCGACGLSCLPREEAHETPCGYDFHPGCGAVYTHITSTYLGEESIAATKRLRPDLPYVDPFEAYSLAGKVIP